MIAATDHVLLALEKLGHKDISELLMRLEREIASCGFILEKTVRIKTEDLRISLTIRQPTEAETEELPLFPPTNGVTAESFDPFQHAPQDPGISTTTNGTTGRFHNIP